MPRLTQEQHFNRTREHIANIKILLLIMFSHYFPAPPLKGPRAPGVAAAGAGPGSSSRQGWLPWLVKGWLAKAALDNTVARDFKIH